MNGPGGTAADRYAIELEPCDILSFHIKKVLNGQEADDFFAELAAVHATGRRRYGRVLILARVSRVQSPVVVLRVRSHALAIKQPDDRNALLVGTVLGKLQMARLGTNSSFGVFTRSERCAGVAVGPLTATSRRERA